MAHDRGIVIEDLLGPRLPAARLAEIVSLRMSGTLTEAAARTLLGHAVDSSDSLSELVERLGLAQVSDARELATIVSSVLEAHSEEVARLRQGEEKLVRFLIGQVMAKTGGRANPSIVGELIKAAVNGEDL